jgi:hypothetical protein
MASVARQTALVTGASGGIGLELARVFAAGGFNLILVARSADRLAKIAEELAARHSITARAVPADLIDPQAPQALFDRLAQEQAQVDVLVNNAGFASYGPFVEAETGGQLDMIQLNVTALTHLTRLFLPGMVARRRGRVLNVASTAAFQPGPLMAVYYATKAFVLSFSEALANELEGSGVTVTALCPGPTESGFQQRASLQESRLFQGGLMDAATVAKVAYAATLRGQTVVIPGTRSWLFAQAPRFLPRGLVVRLVRQAQERTGH